MPVPGFATARERKVAPMRKVTIPLAGAILLAGLALAMPPRAAVPDPDPQSLLDRGRLRLRLGEPDRAIEALLAAIRAAPDSAPARLWLGRALLAKGDAANAQRQLAFAIELAPDDAEAYVAMARAHRDQGRIEASEAVGRRLLGRGHPRGHWIMARALRASGRDAEALAAFDAYLAAATPTEAERQAVAGYRKLVAKRRSGGEGRDLLDWVDNPDLSAAHRRAHDAFVAIANISESQRQGTWPYWLSHYDTLAQQFYPLIGEARRQAEAATPRTALVRGFRDRYLALLGELDAIYRGFLDGMRERNPGKFLQARQRIPRLGAAFEELIEDVDDESEDLADRD